MSQSRERGVSLGVEVKKPRPPPKCQGGWDKWEQNKEPPSGWVYRVEVAGVGSRAVSTRDQCRSRGGLEWWWVMQVRKGPVGATHSCPQLLPFLSGFGPKLWAGPAELGE